jgi:hypothetical protein
MCTRPDPTRPDHRVYPYIPVPVLSFCNAISAIICNKKTCQRLINVNSLTHLIISAAKQTVTINCNKNLSVTSNETGSKVGARRTRLTDKALKGPTEKSYCQFEHFFILTNFCKRSSCHNCTTAWKRKH